MKKFYFITALLLLSATALYAQGYEKTAYVTTTNHKIIIPEDGTLDEALRLSSEWAEAVLKKHPDMLDIKYYLTATEADTMDLLVMYYYESPTTAAGSGAKLPGLINNYWKDKSASEEFLKS